MLSDYDTGLRHLTQAPELLQQRYDTSQHYTWALSGFNAFKSSFYKDGSFAEDCGIVACLLPLLRFAL